MEFLILAFQFGSFRAYYFELIILSGSSMPHFWKKNFQFALSYARSENVCQQERVRGRAHFCSLVLRRAND